MRNKILILILVFLIFLFLIVLNPPREPLNFENYVEVKNIHVDIQTGLLTLETDSGNLSMFISKEQAFSIELALKNLELPRPNTHDIFVENLKRANERVVAVTVDFMKDGTYFATLYIENGRVMVMDIRPSDGIAIAARTNSKIYINPNLLKEEQINLTKKTVSF